jgi:hypothetical protein
MKYFLITYDRSTGAYSVKDFGAMREHAMSARFQLEREHRADPEIEIVVLASDSQESIERTHPRYFHTASELAGNLAASESPEA